jgi:predicted DNA-binding transcriptional regulator AlpA
MKEVCELTGYSRTHIYRLERVGRFPRRRKLGLAKIGFLRSEVHDWIDNLPKPDLPPEDDA